MTSISTPEVVESPSGDRYRVIRPLHGKAFLAINITYGDNGDDGTRLVVVKFEPKNVERSRLHDTARAYNSLCGGPGIPFVHFNGTTENFSGTTEHYQC